MSCRALTAVMLGVLPLLLTIGAAPKSLLSDLVGAEGDQSCCVLGSCCCAMLGAECHCEPAGVVVVDGNDVPGRPNLASLSCSQTVQMLLSVGLAGVPLAGPTVFDLPAPESGLAALTSHEPMSEVFETPTPPPRSC